jgi:hypothetical protein
VLRFLVYASCWCFRLLCFCVGSAVAACSLFLFVAVEFLFVCFVLGLVVLPSPMYVWFTVHGLIEKN